MSMSLTMLVALAATHQGQNTTPPNPTVRPPSRPPIVQNPGLTLKPEDPKKPPLQLPKKEFLWGWADLHAHPAAHMGWGSNENGDGGIFWGKPGLKYGASNPLVDMPACNSDSHYGFDEDVVRKETRKAVIAVCDGITGWLHGSNGGNSFADWPHAQSIVHQQMHINALRRAYDGGQRMMIASVSNNQLMVNLWTKIGFNAGGNAVPEVDPQQDYNSAKKQLAFIMKEAAANSDWMQVVTSAAEARAAIKANKMAIILSLEMDSLTVDQMLDLVKNYRVRHIIPIHLVNNSFGGTAVYSDVFNTSNNYLNGKFFQIQPDSNLEFRLGRPQVFQSAEMGAIKPYDLPWAIYMALGYETVGGGHKNKLGLWEGPMTKLMKKGLLIDVAHMSERSTEQTLDLAEKFGYPVMDSHTGIRHPGEKGHSERDLMRAHAQRIAKLGGVIGLGTEGSSSDRVLYKATGSPTIFRFTGQDHEWGSKFNVGSNDSSIFNLRMTIKTGGDDLRGGTDNADVVLLLKSGKKITVKNINKSKPWGGNVIATVSLPLGGQPVAIGDLAAFKIVTAFGGGIGGDNWNIDEVKFVATETVNDTIGQWMSEAKDALSLLGNRGLAIGTDINGYAPQIPFAAGANIYPFNVAAKYGDKPAGYNPPTLSQFSFGAKKYDFRKDGIAHYGMLSDFLGAIDKRGGPDAQRELTALFRSANYVVEMWEKAEQAAKNVK